MLPSLLPLLRCPRCRAERTLALDEQVRDEREVREGELTCSACSATFAVADGIAQLLPDAPDHVAREAAGLERFAEFMENTGWTKDRILALPDDELYYWIGQRKAINYVLETAPFQAGQRLLDVGSNTCWASNIFARRGLEVVALDIATTLMQGLKTADWFIEDEGGAHFERMLSDMSDPALASGTMDYVFCCEVLHHNSPSHLHRAFAELYRVLKPGGKLFLVNEPMRFPLNLKRDHGEEVAEFEGNENVYFFHEYYRAARAAGFEIAPPWMRNVPPTPRRYPDGHRRAPLERAVRERAAGRAAASGVRIARYTWRHLIKGDVSLFLDCSKPT